MHTQKQLKEDLSALGVRAGDSLLIHSSYKSLGGIEGGAEGFYSAIMELLSPEGTIVIPSLSYATVNDTQPVFDRAETPSCVGYLSEYFRTSVPGVIRSLHPTHSCCALGAKAEWFTKDHELDDTPVGKHSPFAKLPKVGGKILMLGCSYDRNTSMHGVEETAMVPYLFKKDMYNYILKDGDREIQKSVKRHDISFNGVKMAQRYSRIIPLLPEDALNKGKVLDAECVLMSAQAVWEIGHARMTEDPWYFVEKLS